MWRQAYPRKSPSWGRAAKAHWASAVLSQLAPYADDWIDLAGASPGDKTRACAVVTIVAAAAAGNWLGMMGDIDTAWLWLLNQRLPYHPARPFLARRVVHIVAPAGV